MQEGGISTIESNPHSEAVVPCSDGGPVSQSQGVEKKPEQNMTPRKEASLKLRDAGDIIRKHLDQGVFGEEGEDKYTKAQTALSYNGTGGVSTSTKEESLKLQAMIDSVREIVDKYPRDPQAQELNSFFSENIKVFNQADGQIYSLKDWEGQLADINNNDGLSGEQRESKKKELEENAFRGFLLQKEEVQAQEQKVQGESPGDVLIAKYRKSFEQEFKKAEARDDVPKEQMEKIEETLIMLRLAEEANREAGVIFKHLALKNLAEEHRVQGSDASIDAFGKQVPQSIDKMCELMTPEQAKEFRSAINEGKLEDMIKSGKLFKIERMSELLFGKDMTEKRLKEILRIDKKKKWKNPLLLALIILLMGSMEVGKEVLPLPK